MNWRMSISSCVLVLVLAVSCRVHEWPDAGTPAVLEIDLVFDYAMPDYKEVDYGARGTKSSFSVEDMDIRYTLKFYPALPGGGYSSVESSDYTEVVTRPASEGGDCSLRVSLPEGRWTVRCWTDYVMAGSTEDLFYVTADFASVAIPEKYVAGTDFKDAFRGCAEVNLRRVGSAETPVTVRLDMERPLAKFRFIATDLDALVTRVMREKAEASDGADDSAAESSSAGVSTGGSSADGSPSSSPSPASAFNPEDYYIRFYYSQFLPCVFNIFTDKPIDSRTGVSFDSEFVPLSDTEALMGFDYVMVNGHESGVSVQVALYDRKTDRLISLMPQPINVPLERSRMTTVRGDFLTMGVAGGIGVNPSFDGEYIVPIP